LKETWIGKAYYEFAMENDAQSLFCLRNGERKITFAWLMPEVAWKRLGADEIVPQNCSKISGTLWAF